ncbi:hypothetical protein [Mesorhizobium sp. ES1-4]|nr:hypothetical protein [Mesorhizobium sp. ES1-4]MBZ9797266.1 hypothetical protein [Mesorhizobium sp. ES1-4]
MPDRSYSTRSGKWIRIATAAVLLAIVCLMVVMPGHGPLADDRAYMLWVW